MTAIPDVPVQRLPNPMGRIFIPDVRDGDYPLSSQLGEAELRGWRYWWANGWWGDQHYTPQCVSYSWTHWLEDGPRTVAPFKPATEDQHETGAAISPDAVYREAQTIDTWPGENYDGTSVRAGAKVLQRLGWVDHYYWAQNLHDVVQAVLVKGPVIMGSSWYSQMSRPNESGEITVAGDLIGGHAYLINGVNTETQTFRIKNSWGRSWGAGGHAYMSFDTFIRLFDEFGEVCLPTASVVRR